MHIILYGQNISLSNPFIIFKYIYFQLTVELYEMLEIMDKCNEHLRFMDPISDFLYPFLHKNLVIKWCDFGSYENYAFVH